MIYLQLFFEFFKTGLFTIGGALATIPFLQEMSSKTGWFTHAELTDMIAISESTPGPIGINMATYVGYASAGVLGGIIASFALILPSLIIVLIIAKLLQKFKGSTLVTSLFYGLRPASTGLIAAVGMSILSMTLLRVDLWRQTGFFPDLFNLKTIIFAIVLFFLTKKFKTHPLVYIAGSAAIGIALKF